MADVNALASALRTQGRTAADVKGLEEQMAEALALRNTARPEARSMLSGMLANMDRQQGREQVSELQPQLDFARQQAADAGNAQALYNAQVNADNTAYQQDRDTINDQWRQGGNDRALKLWAAKRNAQAGDASAGKYQNTKTNEVATLQVNDRTGQLELDGQPVKGTDWVKYERPLSSGKGGKGGKDEAKGTGMINMLADAFTDDYANPAFGIPMAGDLSNYAAAESPILANANMKDRQNWWGNFERFWSMPIRHDMFGSALTNTEKAIWKSASINPNMDADTIKAKLQIMQDVYEGKYKDAEVNPFTENKPSNFSNRSGLKIPSGVSEDDWNDLDESEQREYLDRFGG